MAMRLCLGTPYRTAIRPQQTIATVADADQAHRRL